MSSASRPDRTTEAPPAPAPGAAAPPPERGAPLQLRLVVVVPRRPRRDRDADASSLPSLVMSMFRGSFKRRSTLSKLLPVVQGLGVLAATVAAATPQAKRRKARRRRAGMSLAAVGLVAAGVAAAVAYVGRKSHTAAPRPMPTPEPSAGGTDAAGDDEPTLGV